MSDVTHTPLPSGRRGEGGLTKEQVSDIQRSRLLFAMAEEVAEQGYPSVSVADVVHRAGVSRATFYELFSDKQDCFLAAFDTAVEVLFGELGTDLEAIAAGRTPTAAQTFARLLEGYLAAIVRNGAFSRVFLIDIHAVPEGNRRRADSQQRFSELLALLFGVGAGDARHFACEALVAAISTMVTARLAVGDTDGILALHDPLVRLAVDLLG